MTVLCHQQHTSVDTSKWTEMWTVWVWGEGDPRRHSKHPILTGRGWSREDPPLPHPKWFSENFGQWGLAFLCSSLGDAGKEEPPPHALSLSPSRAPPEESSMGEG